MLNFTNVALRRGPRLLLEGFSLTVHPGQHLGIVGRNGTGKSSLLALVQGEISPDAGEFTLPRGLRMAHVRQETPALALSALDFVLDGDAAWRSLNQELVEAEQAGDGTRLAALHERLHAIDGYTAPARAARLLYGLGFAAGDEHRAVRDFSGGWRMRLNLAQALMSPSDLLLLDEPTNHLDLDAVLWLQGHLAAYPGTLLLISHDRDFLDAVTSHTLHFERGQATVYTGNYSSCESQRAQRLAQQASRYQAEVRRVEQLQAFIDRFRAKASKARQAQSRVKQLKKMQVNAPAHWEDPFRFAFAGPERMPSPLLKLEHLRVGYADKLLIDGFSLSIEPGDRLGLLGRNGAGKSTLLRTLAGLQAPLGGKYQADRNLRLGYFAQHQVDSLKLDQSGMAHLQRLNPEARDQELRDFLGGFDFHGDRVFEPIAPFSGGEKARLALALLVYQQPNLLLLDEPTNHLDLEMRHAVELALQDFPGAVLLISHDRHLMASCCDELWLVDDGACQPFDGDLDDYARHLKERLRREDEGESGAAEATGRVSAREQRREAALIREQQKPLRDALRRLEKEMGQLEARLADLEQELGDPDLYQRDAARAAELARIQGESRKRLEQVEHEWLELSEQLQG